MIFFQREAIYPDTIVVIPACLQREANNWIRVFTTEEDKTIILQQTLYIQTSAA
jgi:hypothetical protein